MAVLGCLHFFFFFGFLLFAVTSTQVHCVDPVSEETLHVATGLPIMLTCLAVVPWLTHQRQPPHDAKRVSTGLSGGDAGGGYTGSGDDRDSDLYEEVVVAVGGLGGRVRLVCMQVRCGWFCTRDWPVLYVKSSPFTLCSETWYCSS